MPRTPRPPSQPAAEPADPGSESESDQIGVEVAEEIARWSVEEMVILDKYLPKFKEKDKAGRKRLLVWKVLVQMKALYKGKDWSQRKQVNTSNCDIPKDGLNGPFSKSNIGTTTEAAAKFQCLVSSNPMQSP